MKTTAEKILSLICLGLLIILLFQTCFKKPVEQKGTSVTTTKSDTVFIPFDDTLQQNAGELKESKTSSQKFITPEESIQYKPDTNYTQLKIQYDELVGKFLTRNTYENKYSLGTYGQATVVDSVRGNELVGRSFNYNLKIPEVTNTVTTVTTIPEKKQRQLYAGFGISGNPVQFVTEAKLGLMYKDRKDQMYGAAVTKDVGNGPLTYEFQYYRKINLRKKK